MKTTGIGNKINFESKSGSAVTGPLKSADLKDRKPRPLRFNVVA